MSEPRRRDATPGRAYDRGPGSRAGAPSGSGSGLRSRRRPPRGPARGPARRVWGTLPGRTGVFIVIGSAALGALATVIASTEPGALLGVFIIAGALAAALAVRPRAAYLIIPVPALAYVAAASLAGLIHGQSGGSGTALAIGETQWVASGFVTMAIATVLAIVTTIARWPRGPRPGQREPDYPGERSRSAGPGHPDERGWPPERDYPGERGWPPEPGYPGERRSAEPGYSDERSRPPEPGYRAARTGRADRRRPRDPGYPPARDDPGYPRDPGYPPARTDRGQPGYPPG
ncbi:MAG TPA: DUF6542 domain-containing protein, partial [Streptosporangiaceae bacterium]